MRTKLSAMLGLVVQGTVPVHADDATEARAVVDKAIAATGGAADLLVKTEARVKDEETGKEMTEETVMSGYDGKSVQIALKLTVKRDGALHVEAELSDVRPLEKLEDSVFAMP